jgi:hypothetical protein
MLANYFYAFNPSLLQTFSGRTNTRILVLCGQGVFYNTEERGSN